MNMIVSLPQRIQFGCVLDTIGPEASSVFLSLGCYVSFILTNANSGTSHKHTVKTVVTCLWPFQK